MRYVIATTVSIDEVHLADGRLFENQPGSTGFYAMAGVRVFTDDVLILGGTGPTYLERVGAWYRDNRISTDGLSVRGPQVPIVVIHYFPDGTRRDEPNIGLMEFRALDPQPEEILHNCGPDTRGVYVFKAFVPDEFDALIEGRRTRGFKLLWEISEDACKKENIAGIERYLQKVDLFSINSHEAALLYGLDDEAAVRSRLTRLTGDNWIYYRCGSRGGYMLAGGKQYACPSIPDVPVVDTTGGGNSSSAAALYGMCEGFGPQMAGILGSAAAAEIIAQFGVPAKMDAQLRERALARARSVYERVRED